MEKKLNYTKTLKELGIAYLGNHSQSMKMRLSKENGTITYCLYLAPANMSGYEVCPCSQFCRKFCLNGSGHNKADILVRGEEESKINKGRIKRTRLFFENKPLFMQLLIHEIDKTRRYAEKHGMGFSVRLNGTSDLSPEDFVYEGKNILEIYPDVQFYDYTKCNDRFELVKKYNNYDLTFSYNGINWNDCERFLNMGGRVAVVFHTPEMPKKFNGYPVVNGNLYDMRYLDETKSVVHLEYHVTAKNYRKDPVTGRLKYYPPKTPFVIMPEDSRITW